MGTSKFRAWVEKTLPWYSPHVERLRKVKSDAINRRAVAAIEQAERIIGGEGDH